MARIDIRQDIGPVIEQDYILSFMDADLLEVSHQMSENFYPVFAVSHEALGRVGASAFDSGGLYQPFDLGIKTYEALAGTNYSAFDELPPGAESVDPDDFSDAFSARHTAAAFAATVSDETAFLDMLDLSREQMTGDAPVLTDMVTEIADKHLDHDKASVKLALKGASVMRAMHIYSVTHQV